MDVIINMNIFIELSMLLLSSILICLVKNYIINIIGLIILTIYSITFLKTVYIAKKKSNLKKSNMILLILEYIFLYININVFTKIGFSIGQWVMSNMGILTGVIYILAISIIITLWIVITIIWVFRMPKEYSILKSSTIVFTVITIVLFTSTVYYANLFEDYNNYYSNIEINEENGLFLSDGNRVEDRIDYLYFSSVMIFTIGYDEVSILGSGLKIIVASEMFISYLLMCIFVPSIFTLISSKD